VPATPKITYSQCHVDGPYIAMTFDDGPSAENTPRLLDILKERHIHATFFFVGQRVAENPEIVKRIVAEGHDIGNHSWSHPQLSKMNDEAVRNELQKTEDAIVAACGQKPKLMRPPYGAFTARQRAWAHGTWGYKIILWDVDPLDWKIRNSEHVKAEILKQTVPGSIILSHDIHKTTVDAMPATLDALAAKGFKFVTVSELIAMDHPATPRPKATPAAKADAAKREKTEKTDAAKVPASPSPAPAANH
jgi:peptidoglycan/xylan/chitin deacetylase (PgdA/CDA1 family)